MAQPYTIRPTVSQDAISKVGRLFNGSLSDILHELLQNARRAGATKVEIQTIDGEQPQLIIRDNGKGMTDPAILLSLGQSNWDDGIAASEDPAGMGSFSLAGLNVCITSRAAEANGWTMFVPHDAWQGEKDIDVLPIDCPLGTEVLIEISPDWLSSAQANVAAAAKYFPVPVHFNGAEQPRSDFLIGAVHIEEIRGAKIGVFEAPLPAQTSFINFHGVTISHHRMPNHGISNLVDGRRFWTAKVDIIDRPDLQLVLPARKEVVQNAAYDELKLEMRKAIFKAIALQPEHRLSFKDWCNARDLGVILPEAKPTLTAWSPVCSDSDSFEFRGVIDDLSNALIVDYFDADYGQSIGAALQQGEPIGRLLVSHDDKYAGYSWYDRLPRLNDAEFRLESNGVDYSVSQNTLELPDLPNGLVDAIKLSISIAANGEVETRVIDAPALVLTDLDHSGDPESMTVWLSKSLPMTEDAIVSLITNAGFSPSDDQESDSYDTQLTWFVGLASSLATTLMRGEDAALIESIRSKVASDVSRLLPRPRSVLIHATNDNIDVTLDPVGPSPSELMELVNLLTQYGQTKFGSDWDPPSAGSELGADFQRLTALLEGRPIIQIDEDA